MKGKYLSALVSILLLLWYTPVLQTIGSMYGCFEDGERENQWFLVSDPTISCEASPSRTVVPIHALLMSSLVGVGFPLISFFEIRALRNSGRLDYDHFLSDFYQFYKLR